MKYSFIFLFSLIFYAGLAQENKSAILSQTKTQQLINHADVIGRQYKKAHSEAIQFAMLEGLDTTNVDVIDGQGVLRYEENHNLVAANATNTDELMTGGSLGLNLTGAGFIAGIWEATEGSTNGNVPRTNHLNLGTGSTSRISLKDGSSTFSRHATHVAGTMIGNGTDDVNARGMARSARLDAYGSSNDEAEMAIAASNGMLVSNHSYGRGSGWRRNSAGTCWEWQGGAASYNSSGEDADFGRYDTQSALRDSIIFNAPMYLVVQSSGNDNDDNPINGTTNVRQGTNGSCVTYNTSIHPPGDANGGDNIPGNGIAKNILTVGSLDAASGNTIANSSSRGPCDDGRIKPDIMGHGVSVYSSTSHSQTAYRSYSGTSMAAPNVAGSALLLQEYHEDLFGVGQFMRSATLKSLIIHTATDLDNVGPDYLYGWGLMNSEFAAEVLRDANNNDGAEIMERVHGGTFQQFGILSSCADDAMVTMGYSDLPGAAQTTLDNPTPNLVNDLDIRLLNSQTTEFPWILNPSNPGDAATRGDNDVDNIEQIISVGDHNLQFLQVHKEGTLTGGTQAYSMIMTGIEDLCVLTVFQGTGTLIDDNIFCSQGAMFSQATVQSGLDVVYTNPIKMTFSPGFKAAAGSSVHAYIREACN